MKACVSPRLAESGAVFDDQAVDAVSAGLANDAPRATRHLGHHVVPKR